MSWDPYTPGIGNAIVVATGWYLQLFFALACPHVIIRTCPHWVWQHAVLVSQVGLCVLCPQSAFRMLQLLSSVLDTQMCSR